ncbi:hypothetical protein CDV54_07265 [Paracoccus yeei]|nr:hypothetical protein CDV54_07265 [Paracoccus yeei]PZO59291.1 MAG: hypothetical protein DI635_16080 [Pseudoxanthomonas suwonensis]
MVAFTMGLVALSLMREGWPVSDAALLERLNEIAENEPASRITPDMARNALDALRIMEVSALLRLVQSMPATVRPI